MLTNKWLKGSLVLFTAFFLLTWALQLEALARAGGSRSSGSRGSRSFSAPKPYTAPSPTQQPTRPGVTPTTPVRPTPATPPPSQPSSFWRSFGGGMLGGLAGGLLFRSLFGGPSAYGAPQSGGTGFGIGLFDILLLAGIGYLIYWYIKRKRQEAALVQGAYQSSAEQVSYQPGYQQPPYYEIPQAAPAVDEDLERGLGYIRQMDPAFSEQIFQDQAMDVFFKIQGAWASRDMSPVRDRLTEEMYRILQEDADRLKAEGRINRLDNIAVRSLDITEAWQESGSDYITARVYANLLDYVVDDKTGELVSGSKTDPVKFEEYWTFTRPLGPNPWRLSAIQQAA